jgi:hypothetical protein
MPLLSRISGWFERMFDMSVSDDPLDQEDPDGFLMTSPPAVPPALPPLHALPDEELAADPPAFRPVSAPSPAAGKPVTVADLTATAVQQPEGEAPPEDEVEDEALLAAVAAAEAEAEAEAGAGAEAAPVESVATDAPPPAAPAATIPGDAPEATAPAVSLATAAGNPDGDGAGATDDMLAMFRKSAFTSEISHFMKDIEDVPAAEVLTDAREVLDLLGGPVRSDDAA